MKAVTAACCAAGLAVLFTLHAAEGAADYPVRPVRLITPTLPGGTTDILARLFGAKLAEKFQQQVVVDNRASASGVIAGEITARAQPDGYTFYLTYVQHNVNAIINPRLPYHPVNDFTPVSQLTAAGMVLAVHPSVPPVNAREFIEWSRGYKGALNYGSAGNGSGGHLAGELFNSMAGVKSQHIAYRGAGPAMVDLVGGQYPYGFIGMQGAQAVIRSGKVRALAVTTPQRVGVLPDVPTLAESGLPGFEVLGWYGVLAPARLPPDILGLWHRELTAILQRPDIRERITADGAEPVGSAPAEFRKFMHDDLAKWTRVIRQSGAKID